MTTVPANRKVNAGMSFLWGLVVGIFAYVLAESLVPKQFATPGDHDILLANRLGFIYTPMVGLWLGWLQRSWRRAAFGAVTGILIGFVYAWLCASKNFLAIMVGFPCLLGCVLAVIVGSNRNPWLANLGARLGKGLLAGFVLGLVYMIVLNLGSEVVTPPENLDPMRNGFISNDTNSVSSKQYQETVNRWYKQMMWRDGPIALGISSALFFVLIRWAVGLTRVRLFVFDDVETYSEPNARSP